MYRHLVSACYKVVFAAHRAFRRRILDELFCRPNVAPEVIILFLHVVVSVFSLVPFAVPLNHAVGSSNKLEQMVDLHALDIGNVGKGRSTDDRRDYHCPYTSR